MSSLSHKSWLVDFASRGQTLRIATWLVGRTMLRWVLIHDPQMNEVVSDDVAHTIFFFCTMQLQYSGYHNSAGARPLLISLPD